MSWLLHWFVLWLYQSDFDEGKRSWLSLFLQLSFSFLAGAFILAPVIFAVKIFCHINKVVSTFSKRYAVILGLWLLLWQRAQTFFNLAIKRTVFARLYLPDRQIKLKEQSIMVIILKQNQEKAKVDELIHWLENFQVQVYVVNGSHSTILG